MTALRPLHHLRHLCHLRPLFIMLLLGLALAPSAGRPLPAAAASLTFAVTSTTDAPDAHPGDGVCADTSGHCTLRAATQEANAQPSGSTSTITVPAGHYLLSLGALALISNTVVISGVGASTPTIDGANRSQVFTIATGARAALIHVEVTGGNAQFANGGGIANAGSLTVLGSSIISNTTGLTLSTSIAGGGIYNAGNLAVRNSAIVGNLAGVGGGIENTGALWLSGSAVTANVAAIGALANEGGGGIDNSGILTVTGSVLALNQAPYSSIFAPDGGGIYDGPSGRVTIASSAIVSNTASDGGGLSDEGSGAVTVISSTISGNAVSGGGGGLISANGSGTVKIFSSTISSNSASGGGGGVYNEHPTTIVNSTISSNSATLGGGVFNESGLLQLAYDTVAGNSGGVYNNAGTTALQGTIVANSTSGPNCTGPVTESQGYNLDSGASCGFTRATDLTNTNPLLGPLANNGGPTPTMALPPSSPAIDHGGTSTNGCPATDQRGVTRPQGPACDSGAFEAVLRPPSMTPESRTRG